jgi:hypothetical protein
MAEEPVAGAEHVISPKLFDLLDEYAGDLDAQVAIVGNVVPATSPALVFVENAFAQFFENEVEVEIKGFGRKAKRVAARIRLGRKDELSKEARGLIALFEQFCDSYEDVQSASYGGQSETLAEFHQKLMVRLIKRIGALAKANGDEELRERAAETLPFFKEMVDSYDWEAHDPDQEADDDDE